MSTKNKGIVVYLLLAFGMAWILWIIPVRITVSPSDPLLRIAVLPLGGLPGGLAPAVAAIIVRKWVTREGFADAGLKWNLRTKWPYYVFAWLSPLMVALIIAVLAVVLGNCRPDFSLAGVLTYMGPRPSSDIPSHLTQIVFLELVVVSLASAFILWGEEFGWRGYLQTHLLSQHPLLAAVATGLIWGVWHYPWCFLGGQINVYQLLVLPVSTTLLSIIFMWFQQRTGSVWAASLAHAATNYIGAHLVSLWFIGDTHCTNPVLWSYLGVAGWLPLGAFCAWIVFSRQLKSAS